MDLSRDAISFDMSGGTLPLVYVNVLVYNGRRWLSDCLDSLRATAYGNLRILVIDNRSRDDSVAVVRTRYPEIEIIENERNLGFAEGHNRGIRYALDRGAEYVGALNQDLLVHPEWLAALMEVAVSRQEFGILVPMQYEYEGETIDPVFMRIVRQNSALLDDLRRGTRLQPWYEVPGSFGAAVLLRREALLKVGLFDPMYFMYSEDVDFFQRAEYHGVRTAIVTGSKVCHWHVSSQPRGAARKIRITYLAYRNRYLAILKDPRRRLLRNIAVWFRTFISDMVSDLGKPRSIVYVPLRIVAQFWLLFALPLVVQKRRLEKAGGAYL